MSAHFKALSAVFPIIIRCIDGKSMIMLHRRQNTGYMDGKWDISGSGHVDEGETATEAVIRECREELGIDVQAADVEFAHLSHRLSPSCTYYDIYFTVGEYGGTPTIMEPDKCSALEWFAVDALPNDMIDCRRQAVMHYLENCRYSEVREV